LDRGRTALLDGGGDHPTQDRGSAAFSHSRHYPVRVAHQNLQSGRRETCSPASGDGGAFSILHMGPPARPSSGTNFGFSACMWFAPSVWHMAIPSQLHLCCPTQRRPWPISSQTQDLFPPTKKCRGAHMAGRRQGASAGRTQACSSFLFNFWW